MKELREKLRAAMEAARAIVAKATEEKRGLSEEELQAIETRKSEIADLKKQLAALADVEAIENDLRAMAPETQRPVAQPAQAHAAQPPVSFTTNEQYQRGDALAAIVLGRLRYGQMQERASEWARTTWGEGSAQYRALQASSFTAGGATIPENFVASEFIELLRARAAVRQAGARQIPLTNGSATIPSQTGGATAYWVGESETITASEQTFGGIKLVEKKMGVLVPVSNDLLRHSPLVATGMLRDDMVTVAANEEDIAFLNYAGSANRPKGMYYWVGDAGRDNSAGTSLANARTNIRTALNFLGNNNAPMQRRAWFMHSRSLNYMSWDLVDGNSNFSFPELRQAQPTLAGAPVFVDNNISITGGIQANGASDSEIYYAEMSECFIGDGGELEFEVFPGGAYVSTGTTVVSGISRDETVVRLIRRLDFAMRHITAAHVLERVQYGV